MLTDYALDLMRRDFKSRIAYAAYKAVDAEFRADIQQCEILADGRIAAVFAIDRTPEGKNTVTQVMLYDHNDRLLASKAEHIKRNDGEGILYHFRFTIDEK